MKKFSAFLLAALMLLTSASAEGAAKYSAKARGFHGDIELEVTMDAGKIAGIEILKQTETEGIGAAALPKLVEAVLAHQTIGVDSVAGATVTSEAFKAAMADALAQAGADMEKMSAAVEAGELEAAELDSDIVVVGGGAAGLSAGLKALQNGHSVILLEKTGMTGGASFS